jgi:hydrogenase maturation factor
VTRATLLSAEALSSQSRHKVAPRGGRALVVAGEAAEGVVVLELEAGVDAIEHDAVGAADDDAGLLGALEDSVEQGGLEAEELGGEKAAAGGLDEGASPLKGEVAGLFAAADQGVDLGVGLLGHGDDDEAAGEIREVLDEREADGVDADDDELRVDVVVGDELHKIGDLGLLWAGQAVEVVDDDEAAQGAVAAREELAEGLKVGVALAAQPGDTRGVGGAEALAEGVADGGGLADARGAVDDEAFPP